MCISEHLVLWPCSGSGTLFHRSPRFWGGCDLRAVVLSGRQTRPVCCVLVAWCREKSIESGEAEQQSSCSRKMASVRGNSLYQGVYGALRTLLHLTAAVQFGYGIYYDYNYVEFPTSEPEMRIHHPWGGKFKYLTFLDAIIQALYYIVSLVNDFVGTNELTPKKPPAVRRFKDWLMATLAFPVAINVGVTFWTLYAIDRELVFPKVLDPVFPSWLNHVLHTNIVVFIVLELFISYRSYPKRSQGLAGLAIFMGAYLVWIHVVKHYSGVWVYPVLEVLHLPQRILFFAAVVGFTLSLYLLGEFLNNTVWAKEVKLAKRKAN